MGGSLKIADGKELLLYIGRNRIAICSNSWIKAINLYFEFYNLHDATLILPRRNELPLAVLADRMQSRCHVTWKQSIFLMLSKDQEESEDHQSRMSNENFQMQNPLRGSHDSRSEVMRSERC